jgi:hypothetical protein
MKARLDAAFEAPWTWGDSAIYGDYLGGQLTPEAVGRIYEAEDRFVVELRYYSTSRNAADEFARAREQVQRVLRTIEATDVQDADPMG